MADGKFSHKKTTIAGRKFHVKFTLNIAQTVEQLQQEKLREHISLVEIIGSQQSLASHAWYFRGYERLDVHRIMINDAIRTGKTMYIS